MESIRDAVRIDLENSWDFSPVLIQLTKNIRAQSKNELRKYFGLKRAFWSLKGHKSQRSSGITKNGRGSLGLKLLVKRAHLKKVRPVKCLGLKGLKWAHRDSPVLVVKKIGIIKNI